MTMNTTMATQRSTTKESALTTPMGEQFTRALAAKDATRLKALMHSDVDFRALTPGKAWAANDTDEIVDEIMLGTWFDPERQITEVLAMDNDHIGPVERVGYRFAVHCPDGEFVIEQQAYYRTEGDTITWLRIMCTGFLPRGRA